MGEMGVGKGGGTAKTCSISAAKLNPGAPARYRKLLPALYHHGLCAARAMYR